MQNTNEQFCAPPPPHQGQIPDPAHPESAHTVIPVQYAVDGQRISKRNAAYSLILSGIALSISLFGLTLHPDCIVFVAMILAPVFIVDICFVVRAHSRIAQPRSSMSTIALVILVILAVGIFLVYATATLNSIADGLTFDGHSSNTVWEALSSK